MAWTEYEGPLRISRSEDQGATFSDPLHLAGDQTSPARAPALAVDSKGTLYVSWAVGEDANADVRWTRSGDGAETFESTKLVAPTDGYSDAPKLVVDGDDGVHLVFAERAGYEGPSEVFYARLEGGDFSEARVLSNHPGDPDANYPSFAKDARDRLFVVWEQRARGAKWYQGLAMTRSSDAGASFDAPTVVPGTTSDLGINGSLQGGLLDRLAAFDGGQLAVVNSRFAPRKQSVVRLMLEK